MTPREISQRLARDAEGVCAMLLPNGKREGHEWRVGSVQGERGQSLGVHLAGEKAGVWRDFSADHGGDLLDLWRETRGLSLADAIRQAKAHLGIQDGMPLEGHRKPYKRPERPRCHTPKGSARQWLTGARGLSEHAIAAYRVAEDGDFVVFPSLRDGELVRWKKRHIADKHRVETSKDSEPVLFGWQAIPEGAREVVVCEGEIDALSWWDLGHPALSVPNGASGLNWIEAEFEHLARFDTIWLCLDADEPGQKNVAKIAERLGRERVRNVLLQGVKDGNELLLSCPSGTVVQAYFDGARTFDPDELRPVTHYRDTVVQILAGQAQELAGYRTPWEKVGDRFRVRPSEVTVLAGENFSGKSEAVGHFAADIMHQGERVCVASLEMNPETWLARLAQQAGCVPVGHATPEYAGQIVDWMAGKLWVFGVVGTSKVDRMLEVFSYAVRRYGIWLFVIDNLQKCGLADDDYNGQKALVDRLTDFAKEHRVHVILVHHLNKSDDESPGTKSRVKGSGGITDMADNVVIWWRNRAKEREIESAAGQGHEIGEELRGKPDAMMVVEKQRNGGDCPKVLLWFDRRSHQYVESPRQPPRPYVLAKGPAGFAGEAAQ